MIGNGNGRVRERKEGGGEERERGWKGREEGKEIGISE